MTNEELNTALYEKMFAEQETYRAWLLSQSPEETLNHAYLEQAGEDSVLHSNPKNMQAVLKVMNTENIGPWLESAGVSRALQERFRRAMLEA